MQRTPSSSYFIGRSDVCWRGWGYFHLGLRTSACGPSSNDKSLSPCQATQVPCAFLTYRCAFWTLGPKPRLDCILTGWPSWHSIGYLTRLFTASLYLFSTLRVSNSLPFKVYFTSFLEARFLSSNRSSLTSCVSWELGCSAPVTMVTQPGLSNDEKAIDVKRNEQNTGIGV